MTKQHKSLFVFLTLSLLGAESHAGIVSMDGIHFSQPREGYSGALAVGVSGESGNTDSKAASLGGKLVRHREGETGFAVLNYDYGESSGVRKKNKAFMHLRHIHQMTVRNAWEVYTQAASDEFTRLNLRLLAGGGGRLTLWSSESKRYKGFLGVGGFYEQERLDLTKVEAENDTEETLRANCYFLFKNDFNANVSLLSATYFQPDTSDSNDFRASQSFTLTSKFTADVASKIAASVFHDNEPPANVKKNDSEIKFGIEYSF